jgi:hypothetical protein
MHGRNGSLSSKGSICYVPSQPNANKLASESGCSGDASYVRKIKPRKIHDATQLKTKKNHVPCEP